MIYTITLNPAIDRLVQVRGYLTRKKTNRVSHVEYDLGGKGLHVSNVLTRFGIENEALGYIGSSNQELLERILKSKNIHHNLLVEVGASTRECIVVVDESNDGSTMITEDGFHVSDENHQNLLHFIKESIKKNDVVIIAGSMPPNYTISHLVEIINTLKSQECFIACDLSGEALSAVVKMEVNFIKPNQHEIEILLENKDSNLIENIKKLARKIDYVVVSLGKNGSYIAHRDELFHVSPPTVEEQNDTGAGDVFVGTFIAQLVKGAKLETIIKYATGCSASKVTKHNSTDFDIEEAEAYFSEIKITKVKELDYVIS